MKKLYLIAALVLTTLAANAQQKLYLSTYNGTDIAKYDGKSCDVTVNRQMFKGWNTVALPFAMSEQELNETFGADCRLEKLVGAEQTARGIQLNFQDCKAGGIQANTPYILYYTGETGNCKITKEAVITDEVASLSYTTQNGETVTMGGVQKHISGIGLYGVLAVDNQEAKFVKVGENTNGFYATRCFVQLSSGNETPLTTRHLASGEVTSIQSVVAGNDVVDVYSTSGTKVSSKVNASQLNSLKPGIYVVKGQKVLVK